MELRGKQEKTVTRPNTRSNIELAIPQIFSRSSEKVRKFVTVCKLYLRMRIMKVAVEE